MRPRGESRRRDLIASIGSDEKALVVLRDRLATLERQLDESRKELRDF
jgi:hypothetical protein